MDDFNFWFIKNKLMVNAWMFHHFGCHLKSWLVTVSTQIELYGVWKKAFYSHYDNLLLITFAIKWLIKVEVQLSDPKIEGFFFIDHLLGKPTYLVTSPNWVPTMNFYGPSSLEAVIALLSVSSRLIFSCRFWMHPNPAPKNWPLIKWPTCRTCVRSSNSASCSDFGQRSLPNSDHLFCHHKSA